MNSENYNNSGSYFHSFDPEADRDYPHEEEFDQHMRYLSDEKVQLKSLNFFWLNSIINSYKEFNFKNLCDDKALVSFSTLKSYCTPALTSGNKTEITTLEMIKNKIKLTAAETYDLISNQTEFLKTIENESSPDYHSTILPIFFKYHDMSINTAVINTYIDNFFNNNLFNNNYHLTFYIDILNIIR